MVTEALFKLAMIVCEKSPGGDTTPLAFVPDSDTSILQKTSELDAFIRTEMTRDEIPGLTLALVRDGAVVWKKGYGVASSITRRPLSADTALEGASLGKCVAAYAALTLVQDGRIDLQQPLRSYLDRAFCSNSDRGDRITAWHVMTHTSGLSNDLRERTHEVSFEPGARFSYSGVGFMYLQRAIEAIARLPFDDFVRQTIFDRLAMRSSSYFRGRRASSMSRGHGYGLGFALPWPYAPADQPNAANLLSTSAPDLACFVAELMSPTIVRRELVDQMLSPQHPVSDKVSWGLGIGLYDSEHGRCFWHWGDNLDFESYLLGCPEKNAGVVVMTNSSRGRSITREIASRALGK